jgi:tetratricopeptide (TPR) repeat protein
MFPARLFTSSVIISLFIIAGCSSGTNQPTDHLGEISFTATGKDEAQAAFKKGLLLLHSFEYADAGEAFQQARETDPDFVMAFWGEAMTKNHPLWQEQEYDEGNKILTQLAPTPEGRVAKAKTAMEKDFIGGINILYGTGNKAERDSSYAQYMETLYKKYTGDNEVAAFYSLALNGWGTTDQQTSILEAAAKIGYEILQRNPKHPGALHYIIHAYDHPQFAALALATADKYALVAPDAGHALHMPTHTYLALGLWDKVVNSNEVSWAAEQARMHRKKLDNDALGYHAYHWLQYGYLQQGNTKKARAMVDSMRYFSNAKPSPRARSHMIFLKTTYLTETNDYTTGVADITVEQKDLNISSRARNYFVTGMKEYQLGNAAALETVILQLAGERLLEEAKAADKGIRICGNVNRSLATKTDLLEAATMEKQLRALQAWMKKDTAAAEKLFKEATALHTSSGYSYGPPTVVKPSFEMYGEWLLEINRPEEALEQFELALKLMPNKRISLEGKKAAQELLKRKEVAAL